MRLAATLTFLTTLGTAACAGPTAVQQAPPRAVEPTRASPAPGAVSSAGAAAPSQPQAASGGLRLSIAPMTERAGATLGLSVPLVLLTVENLGATAVEVPALGVDLLLSLRVVLTRGERTEPRESTLLRPWTVSTEPLPPGQRVFQAVSPLSSGREDVPLAPGSYRLRVCVQPAREARYPSVFTERYGGICSNELTVTVSSRRRASL